MDSYQEFIYTARYARWLPEKGRRERFPETVERYREFFEPRVPEVFLPKFNQAIEHLRTLDVVPSMRALWSAGPALEKENIAAYNCSYLPLDSWRSFAELMYILMCGTGVGFSVESKYVSMLPTVPDKLNPTERTITVPDSRRGWAEAFLELLTTVSKGFIPRWDLSLIRPKGARLMTFGGRASGPDPLENLFKFTVKTFEKARGRKLTTLECYDIATMTADCVIVGGVRRSATISLSDLDDTLMRDAKKGEYWLNYPQRALSNNSAVYEGKPTVKEFWEEWEALQGSGSGERGIVNRQGLSMTAGTTDRRTPSHDFGVNPCGEIILRPRQFCNLSEVIVRPDDTHVKLLSKVESAVIFGILQSTLSDFGFIDPVWKRNTEEERLLGVSLTGLRDHPVLSNVQWVSSASLSTLKAHAVGMGYLWAEVMGINMPAAITCVKPSGTVSQLTNSSSGIHPRYAPYYIRRVRQARHDPLTQLMLDAGVPVNPEVGYTWDDADTLVFDFPQKAPQFSVVRGNETALEQLAYWRMIKEEWCEHNPSNTIYVRDTEWGEVGEWVYENFDLVGGLSFLPYDGGVYELAPYEPITVERYHKLVEEFPQIDYEKLSEYEMEDSTVGGRELACIGERCELQ